MLAGLIRDDERRVMSGIPGLSDIPVIGSLFANNRRESQQTDIILTLTPRIVRVLQLTEGDLARIRVGRDSGAPLIDIPLPTPLPPTRPPGDVPEGIFAPPATPPATQPPAAPLLPIPQPAQPVKPPKPPPPPAAGF
jgi:general secretion pathway protein D